MNYRKRELAFCIFFLLVLGGLLGSSLIREDRLYSPWEKRMLAQKPKADLAAILDGSYETACETWLTDQFPARDWWVSVKTRCEIMLGKKEIGGVYLGKDGYLFADQKETADWDRLEVRMVEQFGAKQVSRIHVPSAGAVLPEKLPYGICFPAKKDAVWENLRRHREEYIYYRTDHHWTMLGAYYAYETWAKEQGLTPVPLEELKRETIKEDFLGTHYGKLHDAAKPDFMEFFDPGTDSQVVYDLGSSDLTQLYQPQYLESEDAYRFFLDGNHPVVQIETGQKSGHIVILKDSFANCFVPYLTLHYGRITVIDPRHFRMDVGEWLSGQEVDKVLILAQDTVNAKMGTSESGIQSVAGGSRKN